MTRRDVDEFLSRADALIEAPDPTPLTACAWCSHPLDDASPSGEFCGERCAADWRAGLDWNPEERCRCRTCDPNGPWHTGSVPGQRRGDLNVWLEAPLDAAPERVSVRGGRYQITHPRLDVGPRYLEQSRAVDLDQARRAVDLELDLDLVPVPTEWQSLGWIESDDITFSRDPADRELWDLSNDLPPAPIPPWLADGEVRYPGTWLGDDITVTIMDETHMFRRMLLDSTPMIVAAEPTRSPRWVGRKPNRRRRKRNR